MVGSSGVRNNSDVLVPDVLVLVGTKVLVLNDRLFYDHLEQTLVVRKNIW